MSKASLWRARLVALAALAKDALDTYAKVKSGSKAEVALGLVSLYGSVDKVIDAFGDKADKAAP